MATRWSFVGTGRICNDFILCLHSLPRTEHEIVSVADLNLENAKAFASKHGIPKFYDSYEELAKQTNMDIVYIGVINPCHFEVTKIFLQAGKNVLCEKPLAMNLRETEELIDIAKKKKVFFMEGMWTLLTPLYSTIIQEIDKGTIGSPNLIHFSYSFIGTNTDRLIKRHLGGGCVLDIGVYAAHVVTFIYRGEKPKKITATGYLNEDGVDEFVTIALQYSNERIANISLSFRAAGYNGLTIGGPKGILRVSPPFNCPLKLQTPTQTYEIKLPEVIGTLLHIHSEGIVFEAKAVRECLKNKDLLECPLVPLENTRTVSYIMTEVRQQLGVA